MYSRKRQRGIGILGLAFVAIVLAVAGLIGLKLMPVYMESAKISRAMQQGAVQQPGVAEASKREIIRTFSKQLEIDAVTRIHDNNFKEYGSIEKKGGKVTMEISYEAVVPLAGNISLLAQFEKTESN